MHYCLLENLDIVRSKNTVVIKFLTSGSLKHCSLPTKHNGEDQEVVRPKIHVDNILLRNFAPALYLRYDKKQGRLLNYVGLSTIKSDEGKIGLVAINCSCGGS